MKNHTFPSLVPYLDSSRNMHLGLSLDQAVSDSLEGDAPPFIVLSDSDPFSRLLEGQIVTDAGGEAKRLFLVVERDDYRLLAEPLRPVTNIDVDTVWQRAYEYYRSADRAAGFVPLAAQIDDNGLLRRMAPLFFCRAKSSYFHPPCPQCGQTLALCTDDDRLVRWGFASYSHSMRRYLSCESADCTGSSVFYAYEKAVADPPDLRDRWDLIRELLLGKAVTDGVIPCHDCSDRDVCLGSLQHQRSRMVPFSFYPFYLLILDAMSVNALDFSALISGASAHDIAVNLRRRGEYGRSERVEAVIGRAPSGFLFEDSGAFFLEVLYLKLSLLFAIVQDFPSRDPLGHPDFTLSLDRVWVKMADGPSLLPAYWTFTTRPVDTCCSLSQNASQVKSRPDLYSLALLWFCVLTTNEGRDMTAVSLALRERLDKAFSGAGPKDGGAEDVIRSPQPFLPADIFWNPEVGRTTNYTEIEIGLWEKAIAAGSYLIDAAETGEDWAKERFLEEAAALRRDVRDAMFGTNSPRALRPSGAILDDRAIRRVLEGVIHRWQATPEASLKREEQAPWEQAGPKEQWPEEQAGPKQQALEEEELVQTVVVSAKTATKIFGDPGHEKPDAVALEDRGRVAVADSVSREDRAFPRDEELQETVVVSLSEIEKGSPPSIQARDDDLEKTVVISSPGPGTEAAVDRVAKKGNVEDQMEETLLLSLSHERKGP